MKITSNVFEHEKIIPSKYTCDGSDISPSLAWDGVPDNTKSFVLIVDDPDAPHGTWDHWILFNMPSSVRQLPENISTLPEGTQEGKNSWGKTGYGGPCPPFGVHRYFFKLYALDGVLTLNNGATKTEIIQAMKNHVIAEAELLGKYGSIMTETKNTLTGNPALINSGFDSPPDNPFDLLKDWFFQAENLHVIEARAMVLSTVNTDHKPSNRVVLITNFEDGITFGTHEESRKGRDIANNPHVAGNLFWRETMQQINFQGKTSQLSDEASDCEFAILKQQKFMSELILK